MKNWTKMVLGSETTQEGKQDKHFAGRQTHGGKGTVCLRMYPLYYKQVGSFFVFIKY